MYETKKNREELKETREQLKQTKDDLHKKVSQTKNTLRNEFKEMQKEQSK